MDKKQDKYYKNFEVPDPIRIQKVLNLINQHYKTVNGLNILECGVAKGSIADLLSKKGSLCYGVDIHPREISGVQITRADLNDGMPDFNGTVFDVIFAGEVMEHIVDDSLFIRLCYEYLKPSGLLIITVPNLLFVVNRLLMLFGNMPLFAYASYHYHIYTKKTLVELIREQGYRILKVSSSHVLFSTRRNGFGRIFEILGDVFPSFGAHLIVVAQKA